jgi:hypothetical protein
MKGLLEHGHGFLGGEEPPYFAERFSSLAGDLCLELVDLTEDKQEIRVDELPLPSKWCQ